MIESAVRNYTAYSKEATDANREKFFHQFLIDNWHSFADIFRTPVYGFAMTMTYLAGVTAALFNPNALYYTRLAGGTLEYRLLRAENWWELGFWKLSPCFSPFNNIAENSQYAGVVRSWFNQNLHLVEGIASEKGPEELECIKDVKNRQWIIDHLSFEHIKLIAALFNEEEEGIELDEEEKEEVGIDDILPTITHSLIASSLERFGRGKIDFRQKNRQLFNDYWQKLPKELSYTTLGMGQIPVTA